MKPSPVLAPVHSVTAADCVFDYSRGSGKGGQKRNKTSTKARCTHPPSGAVGVSDDSRSQHVNKRIAFTRMALSPAFRAWHKMEIARVLGTEQQVQDSVARSMSPSNLLIEGKDDEGRWSADAIEEETR